MRMQLDLTKSSIQLTSFPLSLGGYSIAKIETPSYHNEPILFPIHKKSLERNIFPLETLKQEQVDEILENKHYRSQDNHRDVGIVYAAQDWFERFSTPVSQRHHCEYELEFSLIVFNQNKTYTIIQHSCYLELKLQIQMPLLSRISEEEQLGWGEKYSEEFILKTLDSSIIHKCDKCYIFENLEKRIQEAAKSLNQ